MLRAIGLLILLAAGVAAAWYLRVLGGFMELHVGDVFVAVPLWLLLIGSIVLFLVLHGLLRGWASLRAWPARARARRAARNRADGDAAVTRALIALAAGTPDQARVEVTRARRMLGDTPHTLLLAAEAERMAGREEAANTAFRALAEREDARFLGLRGLLRAAMQKEDWAEAHRLAREAEAAQPGAAWIREERGHLALRTHDWREALALAGPKGGGTAGLAVAPLALASAAEEPDQARALDYLKRGFEADPGFAPVAVAYAGRLTETGQDRRARKVLEEAWAAQPHPSIAEAYLAGQSDPLTRMKSAEALTHARRQHPESRLLLGREALAASLVGRARAELEALAESGEGDRRVFLALVELERVELGDTPAGRAAEGRWLRAAAAAAPEPRWVCTACGTEQARWEPVCSHCQTVGRIAWAGAAPSRTLSAA
ncbi:heme biosynthesis protein HemY [Roseomonas sp. OT10]|uniref:heme biosynthesis HemY N-terminal domain-containing protein n=1 Tax=Roseomonas cutis TaxID=2897332 RepID=UPI001E38143E|nr:heme biosynthesis HemY N-terminal domain-containing protein [Roseomonas sp. OT10]UFN50411.1 heme biosynthesis protein HemY [Roseomonas sp. OT10]